ncbi:MAG: hypothetical protein ACI8V4_001174 [Ilumatobacter sp.]|jgi:hypothetical protein
MDLYRLRIEVPDDPGRIGQVLMALGRLAINVVEIDCHTLDGDVRIDDLFVHATRPLDIPAIAGAVEGTGCPLVEIRPLAAHDLEDPVTRSMRLITKVTATPRLVDDLIAWCAGDLVRADLGCVVDSRVVAVDSVAGRALAQAAPVQGREWVKRLRSKGVEPWVLAVPFDRAGRRAVVVVVRRTSCFTRTETARLRALLDAASRRPISSPATEHFDGVESAWDLR